MTRRAFSLAELMVVIAVIGVAGALAMFGMSSQVAESRARADSEALLRSLRAEHRAAKERMVGLSVKPVPGGVGVKHQVVFQETARGAECGATGVGPTRTVAFANARLALNRRVLCFNEHGETVDGPTDSTDATLQILSAADEGVLANVAGDPTGNPEDEKRRLHRLALRLDRNGINADASDKVRQLDAPPAPPSFPPSARASPSAVKPTTMRAVAAGSRSSKRVWRRRARGRERANRCRCAWPSPPAPDQSGSSPAASASTGAPSTRRPSFSAA